jgi:NhaP-type Na+/H+ or K+/H+ antiporter
MVGPDGFGLIEVSVTSEGIRTLAEATLAFVLFTDASRLNLRQLRRETDVPIRLLAIGLPLTIVVGTATALLLFPELLVIEAVILAVALAPTDAALGQAVVTDQRVPPPVRQGLNVESGLNYGICVPLLLAALGAASVEIGSESTSGAFALVAEQIGYGLLAGLIAGSVAAFLLLQSRQRRLIDPAWEPLVPLAGVTLAYGGALALGGSGFIAAFVAGVMYGLVTRDPEGTTTDFVDEAGSVLDAVTFILLGAVFIGPLFDVLDLQMFGYAVLSLTVVRMLPVALALLGTKARRPTVAYLGWFGPRGLASLVFAVIILDDFTIGQADLIVAVILTTILLSVVAHGISAVPLTNRYVQWFTHVTGAMPMENASVRSHRWRRRTPTKA